MTPEQLRELDRRLCERLKIEPLVTCWHVGDAKGYVYSNREAEKCQAWLDNHREYCEARGYGLHHSPVYPCISASGDGMWTLMQALENLGRNFAVEHRDGLYDAVVNEASKNSQAARAAHAPLAFACAAARALGIEVPQ